jgi:hypothetical protein
MMAILAFCAFGWSRSDLAAMFIRIQFYRLCPLLAACPVAKDDCYHLSAPPFSPGILALVLILAATLSLRLCVGDGLVPRGLFVRHLQLPWCLRWIEMTMVMEAALLMAPPVLLSLDIFAPYLLWICMRRTSSSPHSWQVLRWCELSRVVALTFSTCLLPSCSHLP